jgi:ankyrin repeat protein
VRRGDSPLAPPLSVESARLVSMDRGRRQRVPAPCGVVAALLLAAVLPAAAHETDQFTVPAGQRFADVGRFLEDEVHRTLESAIATSNERIRDALESGRAPEHVSWLRSPRHIASAVYNRFQAVFFLIEGLEDRVRSDALRDEHPGRLTCYREPIRNIYQHVHFPLDPRQFWRLWHASTIRVHGTYLGPDKIGHFVDMGYRYYVIYQQARRRGLGEAEATERAIRFGTDGLIFAESGVLGYLSAGAYSNADLASNYLGLKFYRNLTETVMLRGEPHPPLLLLEGGMWRLAPHARRGSGFLAAFLSDHYNEALNPSLFEAPMRKAVRAAVRARSADLLEFYADDNGCSRPREYFQSLQARLTTYWGEDYGHRGSAAELIGIYNTCYDDPPAGMGPHERTANGYTALHWAAAAGDVERARALVEAAAPLDARVESALAPVAERGETPLHLACAAGELEVVRLLLQQGADPDACSLRGARPLHRAIGHPGAAAALVAAGADLDAADGAGRTPLHWLAACPQEETAALLLSAGADPDTPDHQGRTPLHRAASHRSARMVTVLCGAGADPQAADHLGATPLHLAAEAQDPAGLELLLRHGADPNARDGFGRAPLHEAARAACTAAVALLVGAGAEIDAADSYGSRALHLAARGGHPEVVRLLLEAGADPMAANAAGSTPLHEAVFGNRVESVEALLEHGADIFARNGRGERPFDLASWEGNRRIALMRLWALHAAASGEESRADLVADLR